MLFLVMSLHLMYTFKEVPIRIRQDFWLWLMQYVG